MTTLKSESESVRRNSETKMPHNSRILKVTWADILWGKSYGPRRGFGAQAGPPGGPQKPENNQKQQQQTNPGNHILKVSTTTTTTTILEIQKQQQSSTSSTLVAKYFQLQHKQWIRRSKPRPATFAQQELR